MRLVLTIVAALAPLMLATTPADSRPLRLSKGKLASFGDSTHGGDYVQILFAKGRRQAIHILENIRSTEFCRAAARKETCNWFNEGGNGVTGGDYVIKLKEELQNAALEWPDPADLPAERRRYCAHVQTHERGKIYLLRGMCAHVTSISRAGEILLHEAWHLLNPQIDSESIPTEIADTFYTAWEYAGHKLDKSVQSTTAVNAPSPRIGYSYVWTGEHKMFGQPDMGFFSRTAFSELHAKGELAIWGGKNKENSFGYRNNGATYDHVLDRWQPIATEGAPSSRAFHTAVWTGDEMIIWGGRDSMRLLSQTAGAYSFVTNTWSEIPSENAPTPRQNHYGLWTGDQMFVWGGCAHERTVTLCRPTKSGGLYDPETQTWTAVSEEGAPAPRQNGSAIMAKDLVFVWGGRDRSGRVLNTGALFDPKQNAWLEMNPLNAPSPRHNHTAVFTGRYVIIWGGTDRHGDKLNSGAMYDILRNEWESIDHATNIPEARDGHTAVWTGTHMLIFGGRTPEPKEPETVEKTAYTPIALYDVDLNNWQTPSYEDVWMDRRFSASVWTGHELVVWGGLGKNDEQARISGRVFYPQLEKTVSSSVNVK